MATRSRRPQRHPQQDERRFGFDAPQEGAPLPTLAEILDGHERSLRSYRTRDKAEQVFVPELIQLIQSSRKALRDERLEEVTVNLFQIERIVGFQQGVEHAGGFLRREVLPTVMDLWWHAKRETRSDIGREIRKNSAADAREDTADLLVVAARYREAKSRCSLIDSYRYVAKSKLGSKATAESIEQRAQSLARMDREGRKAGFPDRID